MTASGIVRYIMNSSVWSSNHWSEIIGIQHGQHSLSVNSQIEYWRNLSQIYATSDDRQTICIHIVTEDVA